MGDRTSGFCEERRDRGGNWCACGGITLLGGYVHVNPTHVNWLYNIPSLQTIGRNEQTSDGRIGAWSIMIDDNECDWWSWWRVTYSGGYLFLALCDVETSWVFFALNITFIDAAHIYSIWPCHEKHSSSIILHVEVPYINMYPGRQHTYSRIQMYNC